MSNAETTEPQTRASLGTMVFGHAILFLACVFLPAVFTAAAPLTFVHLERENGLVRATASRHVLFLIPYSRTSIENVQAVGDQLVSGARSRSRDASGKTRKSQTEDSAYLLIEGPSGQLEVPVSPVNIKSILQKTSAFVSDPAQSSLRFVAVANWKFGVIAGGVLSLLTVFYLWLQISSLLRWLKRIVTGRPAGAMAE